MTKSKVGIKDGHITLKMKDMELGKLYELVDDQRNSELKGHVVIRYSREFAVDLTDTKTPEMYWDGTHLNNTLVRELPQGSSITLTQE